jgi:hypothetical protein
VAPGTAPSNVHFGQSLRRNATNVLIAYPLGASSAVSGRCRRLLLKAITSRDVGLRLGDRLSWSSPDKGRLCGAVAAVKARPVADRLAAQRGLDGCGRTVHQNGGAGKGIRWLWRYSRVGVIATCQGLPSSFQSVGGVGQVVGQPLRNRQCELPSQAVISGSVKGWSKSGGTTRFGI